MFFDISFWQALVAEFFATLFGVVLGIVIALWLNRRQERILQQKDEREEEKRKEKIIGALGQESYENLMDLLDWNEGEQKPLDTGLLHVKLKTETWGFCF